MYALQTDCISQIESTIESLDQQESCRVYITYSHETPPVEFVTHQHFRMLPSHIKTMSWLLAIRNPVKISFESHTLGPTELILSTKMQDTKQKTRISYTIRKVTKEILSILPTLSTSESPLRN